VVLAIVGHWQGAPETGLGEVYYCVGAGVTTWCGLAHYTRSLGREMGGLFAEVTGVTMSEWPTKAPGRELTALLWQARARLRLAFTGVAAVG
jgi:hypothetical protein